MAAYNSNFVNLYSVYDPGLDSDIKVTEIGNFTNKRFVKEHEKFYESRKNLTGTLMRSGNVVSQLLVYVNFVNSQFLVN